MKWWLLITGAILVALLAVPILIGALLAEYPWMAGQQALDAQGWAPRIQTGLGDTFVIPADQWTALQGAAQGSTCGVATTDLQAIVQVMPGLSADVPQLTQRLCNLGYAHDRTQALGKLAATQGLSQGAQDFATQINEVAATIQQGSTAPGRDVLAIAHEWLGVPYLFGGCSHTGVDCSCLTQLVFRAVGVNLPRTALEQFNATQRVSNDQAQPGDLVFFANTYMPGISHVGIYLGDGQQINAPTTGEFVAVAPVFSGYWGAHLAGFGRVRRPATTGGQA